MFGLSLEERIYKAIKETCISELHAYRHEIDLLNNEIKVGNITKEEVDLDYLNGMSAMYMMAIEKALFKRFPFPTYEQYALYTELSESFFKAC